MIKRLFISFCFVAVSWTVVTASTLDSLLNVLESEIAHSDVYLERKNTFIHTLCASKPMTPELQLRIAREYQHFQSDSSLVWYLKLQDADEPIRTEAFIGMMQLLAYNGYYGNAILYPSEPVREGVRSS